MCTSKRSPTAVTRAPSADISMPEASMATCPLGVVSTSKIAAGSAAIGRCTDNRCCVTVSSLSLTGDVLRTGAQAAHPAQPAVRVGRLALHVRLHLRVRQDQEAALAHGCGDDLGDVLRLDDAVGGAVAEPPRGHRRVDALWA